MDRAEIIRRIQFILFDVYDENPSVLNAKYFGGYYNEFSDVELFEMYADLKHESENLQYKWL